MTHAMTTLRDRLQKHVAYRRTAKELRSLPHGTALDLGIRQGDADKIAARAVYGA
ncbi:MAG: hypothetical protein RID15_05405 [Marinovum algicola]|uniref:DUF1127 domain-containing protein n=1 Tax=Marinovum algicola TaxID=42444 RepID=A0A975W8R5_9RHOB|nr:MULTISPECIES: hypothetical protein [Marinovum]AKO97123.1 Domain protein of unknown function [Marinovum algicola DG 898]MDD9739922.1 hypothetical protein [Marinovum sp. SP66]MDD9742513.1 hypothetical protein [Marinovum sp. PR37]SEJ13956.1 hypothetical protein SAMN04487940_103327 [Marinovum algicola]SLN21837.1 hypothetical protein MAA5396_00840 [Marinovum algicola]